MSDTAEGQAQAAQQQQQQQQQTAQAAPAANQGADAGGQTGQQAGNAAETGQAGGGQQGSQSGQSGQGEGGQFAKLMSGGSLKEALAVLRDPAKQEALQREVEGEAGSGQQGQQDGQQGQGENAGAGDGAGENTGAAGEQGQQGQQQGQGQQGQGEDGPNRIRIGSFDEADRDLLVEATSRARRLGIPVRTALAELMAKQDGAGAAAATTTTTAAAAQAQEQQTQEQTRGAALEAQRTKVKNLSAELKTAIAAFDNEKQAELTTQLIDEASSLKLMESEQAHEARSTEAQAQTQWKSAETQSFAATETMYPEFQQAGSPLNVAVQAEIARADREDPGFFERPNWIEFIVAKEAAKLGLLPSTARAAAQPPARQGGAAQQQQQQQRAGQAAARQGGHPAAVSPAPGNSGQAAATGAEAEVGRVLSGGSLKEHMAALRNLGTRRV